MNEKVLEEIQRVVDGATNANRQYLHIWKEHMLWTWMFWFEFLMLVGPILLWLKYKKRESTDRLLLVGLFVLLVSSWLDFAGNSYGLWLYPYKLIPMIPPVIPWDVLFSIEVMFLLQWQPNFSPLIKAIGLAVVNAFIGEPIAKWMGLYIPTHWSHLYSLPIYIGIYYVAYRLSRGHHFSTLS